MLTPNALKDWFATLWFAVIVGAIALAAFRRLYDRNTPEHDERDDRLPPVP